MHPRVHQGRGCAQYHTAKLQISLDSCGHLRPLQMVLVRGAMESKDSSGAPSLNAPNKRETESSMTPLFCLQQGYGDTKSCLLTPVHTILQSWPFGCSCPAFPCCPHCILVGTGHARWRWARHCPYPVQTIVVGIELPMTPVTGKSIVTCPVRSVLPRVLGLQLRANAITHTGGVVQLCGCGQESPLPQTLPHA